VDPVASHVTFGTNQGEFSQAEIFRRCCEAVGRYCFARQAAIISNIQ